MCSGAAECGYATALHAPELMLTVVFPSLWSLLVHLQGFMHTSFLIRGENHVRETCPEGQKRPVPTYDVGKVSFEDTWKTSP